LGSNVRNVGAGYWVIGVGGGGAWHGSLPRPEWPGGLGRGVPVSAARGVARNTLTPRLHCWQAIEGTLRSEYAYRYEGDD